MNYELKYKKYKIKYLNLQEKLNNNQLGGSNKPNVYLFKAEWCGHCKNFLPHWKELNNNNELKEKVNFITMDADINTKEINDFKIEGFPSLIFENNKKQVEYNGKRTSSEIIKFINNNLSEL